MALVYCRECGSKISDKALACPKCGALQKNISKNKNSKSENRINDLHEKTSNSFEIDIKTSGRENKIIPQNDKGGVIFVEHDTNELSTNKATTIKQSKFSLKWTIIAISLLTITLIVILLIIPVNETKTTGNNIEFTERNSNITKQETSNLINGYEYVDLGLSVKWATCNVGANSCEEFGNYYAWGETSTKNSYTKNNSSSYGIEILDISGISNYDVAAFKMGDNWRLPTKMEATELKDKCKWIWTKINDKNGYKVIGPNGNSIFLPVAGYCGSSHGSVNERGNYWTSTPNSNDNRYAFGLYFDNTRQHVGWDSKYDGYSIRPVLD